jgi:hypothetical protein
VVVDAADPRARQELGQPPGRMTPLYMVEQNSAPLGRLPYGYPRTVTISVLSASMRNPWTFAVRADSFTLLTADNMSGSAGGTHPKHIVTTPLPYAHSTETC